MMYAAEFKMRLDGLRQAAAKKQRIPADQVKVDAGPLIAEAIYSIAVNGDLISRRLAAEILKAGGA